MKPLWPYAAAALLLGGAIHIAIVLGLPHLASKNAWARLEPVTQANAMQVLPPVVPDSQPLPYMAPDVRYALCRYDLADGPVRLGISILDELWMIAFYTPRGDNYYAISGGDIRRERVEFIISSQAETLLELEMEAAEESENVIVVRSPGTQGLAMIRAPLRGAGYNAQTEEALGEATCSVRAAEVVAEPEPPRRARAPDGSLIPPLPQRRDRL